MNLNQVTIAVKNIEVSILFYKRLGLTLIVKSLPHYARFACPDGQATFSLHQVNDVTTSTSSCIHFEITELDTYVNKLVSEGFVFDELPVDKPWLWREARLKDPDGHQLILYFAGSNRLYPPWRID